MMFGNPITARLMPGDGTDSLGAVGFGDFKFGFSIYYRFGPQAHQLGCVGEPQLRLRAGGVARKHAARVDDKLFLSIQIRLCSFLCGGRRRMD
jgi:hypothetical protein